MRNIYQAAEDLGQTIAAFAASTGSKFPNVTVDNFEVLASQQREISGIELMTFTPIVTDEQRLGWQEFAWNNQQWISESRRFAVGNDDESTVWFKGKNFVDGNITPLVYEVEFNPDFNVIPARLRNGVSHRHQLRLCSHL